MTVFYTISSFSIILIDVGKVTNVLYATRYRLYSNLYFSLKPQDIYVIAEKSELAGTTLTTIVCIMTVLWTHF